MLGVELLFQVSRGEKGSFRQTESRFGCTDFLILKRHSNGYLKRVTKNSWPRARNVEAHDSDDMLHYIWEYAPCLSCCQRLNSTASGASSYAPCQRAPLDPIPHLAARRRTCRNLATKTSSASFLLPDRDADDGAASRASPVATTKDFPGASNASNLVATSSRRRIRVRFIHPDSVARLLHVFFRFLIVWTKFRLIRRKWKNSAFERQPSENTFLRGKGGGCGGRI